MSWLEFFSVLTPIFSVSSLLLFFILVFYLIFFVVVKGRSGNKNYIFYVLFLLPIFFGFFQGRIMSWLIVDEIRNMKASKSFLIQVDGESTSLQVRDRLYDSFLNKSYFKSGGSGPRSGYYVGFSSGKEKIILVFREDSEKKNVYWVFCESISCPSDIGLVKTDVFAELKNLK